MLAQIGKKGRTFIMKGFELTVVAAITATMLTSEAFAKAVHRNFEDRVVSQWLHDTGRR